MRSRPLVIWSVLASWAVPCAVAADDITIAVANTSEVHEIARSREIVEGAEEAVAVLNASGGLFGRKLTIAPHDDGCSRSGAAEVAGRLAAEKPALVLGHVCPRASVAAAAVYGKDGVLYIATANRHPELTEKRAGSTIFRLSGRDDQQGESVGAMLAQEFKDGQVALVQDRTRYARAIFDKAAAYLKKASGKAPITATIIGGDKEYKATIAKTKQAAAVFFSGFPIEAGFVHAALQQAGSNARFIGSDTLATDEFASTFGRNAQGVRVIAVPGPDIDAGGFHALSDRQRAKAAVLAFAEAARQAGTLDAGKVAEALGKGEFASDMGVIRFDTKGDAVIPAFAVLEWNGSEWTTAGETPPVIPINVPERSSAP